MSTAINYGDSRQFSRVGVWEHQDIEQQRLARLQQALQQSRSSISSVKALNTLTLQHGFRTHLQHHAMLGDRSHMVMFDTTHSSSALGISGKEGAAVRDAIDAILELELKPSMS